MCLGLQLGIPHDAACKVGAGGHQNVELAGLVHGHRGLFRGHDDETNAVDPGRAVVVVLEGLKVNTLPAFPFRELVRAGSGRNLHEPVRPLVGHHLGVEEHEGVNREQHVGCCEDDLDHQRAHDLHAGQLFGLAVLDFLGTDDALQVLQLQAGLAAGRQQRLETGLHVLGAERPAGVELDIRAQLETPGQVVRAGGPLERQRGQHLAGLVHTREVLVDVAQYVAGYQGREGDRVYHFRVGVDVDAQVARLRQTVQPGQGSSQGEATQQFSGVHGGLRERGLKLKISITRRTACAVPFSCTMRAWHRASAGHAAASKPIATLQANSGRTLTRAPSSR